jgi:hypothetical protein
MTKREQILAASRTALTGTTGVAARIYRSRVEPMARQESPAIVVEPIEDVAQQNTSLPTLDWSLTVRIAVVVRANLGGLAMDIQPQRVEFQTVEADQPAGVVMCDYLVRYRSSVTNLAA